MKTIASSFAAAMIASVMAVGVAPAQQPTGGAGPTGGVVLSESQILERLRAEGYTNISNLNRSGNVYNAQAIRNGQPVRLAVDARSGKILFPEPPRQ